MVCKGAKKEEEMQRTEIVAFYDQSYISAKYNFMETFDFLIHNKKQ